MLLQHYTDASGLIGIIDSNSFHSTNVEFMNDYTELQFARMAIDSIIGNTNNEDILSIVEKIGDSYKIKEDRLPDLYGLARNFSIIASVYATSFSKPNGSEADTGKLSQWRGYAHSQGVCLNFDFDESASLPNCILRKVEYSSEKEIRHKAKIFIDEYDPKIDSALLSRSEEVLNSLIGAGDGSFNYLMSSLSKFMADELIFSSTHKSSGFSEESEYRIITMVPDQNMEVVKFKSGRISITPYVTTLEGEIRDRLKSIIVGPGSGQERRVKAIQLLLRKYGLGIPVIASSIPYDGS